LREPEIDIVIWAQRKKSIRAISKISKRIFEKAASKNLHLALIQHPVELLPGHWETITKDDDYVTCLRSCLMKPEHEEWIDEIWAIVTSSLE